MALPAYNQNLQQARKFNHFCRSLTAPDDTAQGPAVLLIFYMVLKAWIYISENYFPMVFHSYRDGNHSQNGLTSILITINLCSIDEQFWSPVMYVCICKGITDHQIKDAVYQGATSVGRLRKTLGVASQCGKCLCHAQELINETQQEPKALEALPQYYAVA